MRVKARIFPRTELEHAKGLLLCMYMAAKQKVFVLRRRNVATKQHFTVLQYSMDVKGIVQRILRGVNNKPK
jgi:hypothetical protein